MGKASIGPGFRFKPTDVELVQYYLKRKLMGRKLHVKVIAELDIYKYEPWDLPDKSCWESGDLKWYFFCPREKKYRNGNKIHRATEGGYWKTTGKERSVVCNGEVVGKIKTLVFHTGRAPQGNRTDWVMHEYRLLEDQGLADKGVPLDSYVLCIIFQKEGPGPRNGAQYGVPFKEEDWSDDEVEISSEVVQDANLPEQVLGLPSNYNSPTTNTHTIEDIGIGYTSGSCISDILQPSCMVLQPISSDYVTQEKPHAYAGDDFQTISDCFPEEDTFFMNENGKSNAEICLEAVPSASMPEPDLMLPNNYYGSIAPSTCFSDGIRIRPSDIVPPPCNVLRPETGDYVTTEEPHVSNGDDILSLLDCFTEETSFCMYGNDKNAVEGCLEAVPNANMPQPDLHDSYGNDKNGVEGCLEAVPNANMPQPDLHDSYGKNEECNDIIRFGNADATPHFNTSNVYEDLADLGNLAGVCEGGYDLSSGTDSMSHFLELRDLDQPQHPSLFF